MPPPEMPPPDDFQNTVNERGPRLDSRNGGQTRTRLQTRHSPAKVEGKVAPKKKFLEDRTTLTPRRSRETINSVYPWGET